MDQPHVNLIADITEILVEASHYQFHDYKNSKYAMPKFELVNKLNDLATKVKDGVYDNEIDEEDIKEM